MKRGVAAAKEAKRVGFWERKMDNGCAVETAFGATTVARAAWVSVVPTITGWETG